MLGTSSKYLTSSLGINIAHGSKTFLLCLSGVCAKSLHSFRSSSLQGDEFLWAIENFLFVFWIRLPLSDRLDPPSLILSPTDWPRQPCLNPHTGEDSADIDISLLPESSNGYSKHRKAGRIASQTEILLAM